MTSRSLFLAAMGCVFFGFLSNCGALTVNNANFEIGAVNLNSGFDGFWVVDEPPTPGALGLNAGFGAAGWQVSVAGTIRGLDYYDYNTSTVVPPHSGHITANFLSPSNQGMTTLSQIISTSIGGQYQLHFWLANPDTFATDNRFSVTWGGVEVRPVASGVPPLGTNWVLPAATGWVEYVIPISASSASTVLAFSGYNNVATLLDDVSIVNVPEPGTASAFVIGTLALALRRRRSRAGREYS